MEETKSVVSTRWIKYTLLCVSVLLMISSLFVITVGTSIYSIYRDVAFILYYNYYNEAIVTLIIGVIVLFVSLLGLIGSLKENTCLVNLFAVALGILLVWEFCVAVNAFYDANYLYGNLVDNMGDFINDYHTNRRVLRSMDSMQIKYHCCGVESYKDWQARNLETINSFVFRNITVPRSCCEAIRTNEYNEFEKCTVMNTKGCLPFLDNVFFETAVQLVAVALTVAFIQIIGVVVSSFSLARSIRRMMRERQTKSCEMQEKLIKHYTAEGHNLENKTPFVYRLFSIGPLSLVCTKDLA